MTAAAFNHDQRKNMARLVHAIGWIGPTIIMFAPFYPAAIRAFGFDQFEFARIWVKLCAISKAAD
jgi:hypothetical protein